MLGIRNVLDLIEHYPRRYLDRTKKSDIADLRVGEEATVYAEVRKMSSRRTRQGRALVETIVYDGTSYLYVTFSNQAWRAQQLPSARRRPSSAARALTGQAQMTNPAVRRSRPDRREARRDRADYPQSGKADVRPGSSRSWWPRPCGGPGSSTTPSRRICSTASDRRPDAGPTTDPPARHRGRPLPGRRRTHLRRVPPYAARPVARKEHSRSAASGSGIGSTAADTGLHAQLPFGLTGDQQKAIAEISADLTAPRPMHRLLQGDVGSGKTVVALTALLTAVQGGYQGALMAPTEVLAEQHHLSISRFLQGLTVSSEGTLMGSDRRVGMLNTGRVPRSPQAAALWRRRGRHRRRTTPSLETVASTSRCGRDRRAARFAWRAGLLRAKGPEEGERGGRAPNRTCWVCGHPHSQDAASSLRRHRQSSCGSCRRPHDTRSRPVPMGGRRLPAARSSGGRPRYGSAPRRARRSRGEGAHRGGRRLEARSSPPEGDSPRKMAPVTGGAETLSATGSSTCWWDHGMRSASSAQRHRPVVEEPTLRIPSAPAARSVGRGGGESWCFVRLPQTPEAEAVSTPWRLNAGSPPHGPRSGGSGEFFGERQAFHRPEARPVLETKRGDGARRVAEEISTPIPVWPGTVRWRRVETSRRRRGVPVQELSCNNGCGRCWGRRSGKCSWRRCRRHSGRASRPVGGPPRPGQAADR